MTLVDLVNMTLVDLVSKSVNSDFVDLSDIGGFGEYDIGGFSE